MVHVALAKIIARYKHVSCDDTPCSGDKGGNLKAHMQHSVYFGVHKQVNNAEKHKKSRERNGVEELCNGIFCVQAVLTTVCFLVCIFLFLFRSLLMLDNFDMFHRNNMARHKSATTSLCC